MTWPGIALTDQWSGTPYVTETDMFNRFDARINQLAPWLNNYGNGTNQAPKLAYFWYEITGAQTVSVNVTGSVQVDNFTAWDATNRWYVVPQAGLYVVHANFRQQAAGVGNNMQITGLPTGYKQYKTGQDNVTLNRGQNIAGIARMAGGEHISAIFGANATCSAGHVSTGSQQSWLSIAQVTL